MAGQPSSVVKPRNGCFISSKTKFESWTYWSLEIGMLRRKDWKVLWEIAQCRRCDSGGFFII